MFPQFSVLSGIGAVAEGAGRVTNMGFARAGEATGGPLVKRASPNKTLQVDVDDLTS